VKCKVCLIKFQPCYPFQKTCGDDCLKEYRKKVKVVPIKKVSDKRVVQNKKYLMLRSQYLSENTQCQIGSKECTGTATTIHHRMSGADRQKHYLDVPSWMGLCLTCHIKVETSPNWARKNGYIK